MKRVLCAVLFGAAAFTAVPADAAGYDVNVVVWNSPGQVGVGAEYTTNGSNYEPLGSAYVNPQTGAVCFGLSFQTGTCVALGAVS